MKIQISYDTFDSINLKRECFKIVITEIDDLSNLGNIERTVRDLYKADSIFIFSPHNPLINEEIRKLGFSWISTKNIYSTYCSKVKKIKRPDGLTILNKEEILKLNYSDEFSDLIESLVVKSRFWKDVDITKEFSRKIYDKWFFNSIYTDFSDEIFVIQQYNNILGFITLKERSGFGYIDLIAVDKQSKGSGIGAYLLYLGAKYFIKRNIVYYRVETEGENIEANRFYQKNSFLLDSHILVFHKHNLI